MPSSYSVSYLVRVYQSSDVDETEYVYTRTLQFAQCADFAKSASIACGRAVVRAAYQYGDAAPLWTTVVEYRNGQRRVLDQQAFNRATAFVESATASAKGGVL